MKRNVSVSKFFNDPSNFRMKNDAGKRELVRVSQDKSASGM